jgi:hypothetical protein
MKYTTLNEEMLRMKSLMTEERLYGNLVDKENILTEVTGGRTFGRLGRYMDDVKRNIPQFRNAEYRYKGTIEQMQNYPINDTNDLFKHLVEFEDVWGLIVPYKDLTNAKKILQIINKQYKGNLLDVDLFKKGSDGIMPIQYIPREGGIRQMVLNLVKDSGGKWAPDVTPINKPVTDLVVTTGPVGTSIVKRGKNNYLVPTKDDGTLDLDPEGTIIIIAPDGKKIKTKPGGDSIEDIPWEDVTDIGVKPVRTTPIKRVVNIIKGKTEEAAKEGQGISLTITGKEAMGAVDRGGLQFSVGGGVPPKKVWDNTPADKTSKTILSEDPRFSKRFHKFLATAFEWYADPFQIINKMKKNSEFIKKIFPAEVIKHDKNIGRSYLYVTTKRFAINIGTTSALLGYALEPGSEYVPSSIAFENSDDYTFSTIIFTYIRNTLEMRYYFKFILERDFRNMCNRISEIGIDCEDLKKDFLKETERLTLDGDCTSFASQKSGEKYVRSNLVKYMNKNYGEGDTDMQSTGGDIVGWLTETTFWGNIVRLWTYINDETGTNPFSQAVAAKVLSCSEGVTNTKITPIPGTEEEVEVDLRAVATDKEDALVKKVKGGSVYKFGD